MTSLSFRALLLLSTSLLISGCDQSTETSSNQGQGHDISAIGQLLSSSSDTPPATLSGDYLAGQFAQSRSDWVQASDYFARVLDATPTSSDIKRRVMALDMGAGQYDKALILAKDVNASDDPDKTLARMLLALSEFKHGRYQDALTYINQGENDGLNAAVLPLLRAWSLAAQGKADVAALKDSPSLIYQAVLVADYTKDKTLLAALAKAYDFTRTPTPISRLEDIAAIFARNGETAEASGIFKTLQMAIPERAKHYTEAIEALGNDKPLPASLQTAPDTPQTALSDALFDMARLLSSGYPDSARLFAQMSLFLNPDNSNSLELLAQVAADNKLFSEAVSFLSRIDAKDDKETEIRLARQTAALTKEAGQTDEAIRILANIANTHKSVDAQIQIGDIYREAENYADALKSYNKAYDMLGGKITAQYWDLSFARGIANERMKNWEQAEKDLQTALLYEPDQPYVLNYLGYSWADQGENLDKAAEMIEKAVRLKPDDGAIVDSLGWVYFRMGEFGKAAQTLEKAIELSPTEAEINDHLGDAYWRVGRKSEARFQWKRAISFCKDAELTKKMEEKIINGLPELPPAAAEKVVKNTQ